MQPASQAVVIAVAPSGKILFSSAFAADVVGRRLSELAQLDAYAMFHRDGRRYAPSEWMLARSIASEEVIVDEQFFRLAEDGRRVEYRASSYPVYDAGGRLVAAVSVARDVTAEVRTETGLAYHASLLANVDDAVVGTGPDFRLTVWNRGAERLYGFTADEVLGRPARDVASYAGDSSPLLRSSASSSRQRGRGPRSPPTGRTVRRLRSSWSRSPSATPRVRSSATWGFTAT